MTVFDRARAPLLGASLHGEGKIHLGYVYGNEPGRNTAAKMVEGALAFAPLVDQWVPKPIDWHAISSEPFLYAVLADTMVSPERLADHYEWVDDAIEEQIGQGARYMGRRVFTRAHRLAEPQRAGMVGDVVATFQTNEIAVDPERLRVALLEALQAEGIDFYPHSRVMGVSRTSEGFAVEVSHDAGTATTWHVDAVVNCLWDSRLAIDATLGIHPARPCIYRLKYVVNARLDLPPVRPLTTTFVLGPFGDVVWRGDGRVYLSWYPACMVDLSTDLHPPASWYARLNDPDYMGSLAEITAATVHALSHRIEALRDVRVESVSGGVIVAWGENDIDHPASELHRRHAIGVHAYDGYLSVDTGKLTTAPLFAQAVVDVLGRGTYESSPL